MKNFLPATLLCDFYKISHKALYDKGTETIYSTWTARNSRLEGVDKVVIFGYQSFIKKYLVEYFNENFFNRDLDSIINEYSRVLKYCLNEDNPDISHIKELHELGYLPLKICALPEGTLVPIRVPSLTIENTDSRFFWLTNFIETLFSCEVWQATTSATLAYQYRLILDKWADKTCDNNFHVDYQAHDFSMRGMSSLESAMLSGAGHLLSFKGTDTIPSIIFLEKYYNADMEYDQEIIGTSVPATEHSIMCCNSAFTKDSDELREYNAFKRIITEVHPKGIVSIVSDTWNLWDVLTKTIPALKDEILNRDGKVVIRPDSGNPVDIICGERIEGSGNLEYEKYYIERKKGVVELLWETFGGTINSKGYKVLDSHIGAIYGDAITLERAEEICSRLESKGFASSNIVFGVGSYTYQYNTRDTFGHALKSTYAIKDGKEVFLYKDPITDDGIKKSQKGKVAVVRYEESGELELIDELNQNDYEKISVCNFLETIYEDGKLIKEVSLGDVRSELYFQTHSREFSF